MCGIVAVAQRDIAEILLEGLRRLEYRGYDSAGLAVVDEKGNVSRLRRVGKVQKLAEAAEQTDLGGTGTHTRWATHGEPTEANAHPHVSDYITVVHNGIIEKPRTAARTADRTRLLQLETDTEVIAHRCTGNSKAVYAAGSGSARDPTTARRLRHCGDGQPRS